MRKGVILTAGGATRLRPLSYAATKCLLPLFDKPMVISPLDTLRSLGIKDFCVVTDRENLAAMERVMGHYGKPDEKFVFEIQEKPTGTAHALNCAKAFFGNGKVAVIFGDNVYERAALPEGAFDDDYAYVFAIRTPLAAQFAVVEFDASGNPIGIEEKPKAPKSDVGITGLALYPSDVFELIKRLKPTHNGEVYLADVNDIYLKMGRLKIINVEGAWSDVGTIDTYLKEVGSRAKKQGYA